jgi:single-stranded DNA-binding protein
MNTTTIAGFLVADPELRYEQRDGRPIATFVILVDGEGAGIGDEDGPGYFEVVVHGRLAENCATSLIRDTRILAAGRMDVSGGAGWRNRLLAEEVGASLLEVAVRHAHHESQPPPLEGRATTSGALDSRLHFADQDAERERRSGEAASHDGPRPRHDDIPSR